MSKNPEKPITFETEGESYEAIRILIRELNRTVDHDSPASRYISYLNEEFEFFQKLYKKNVRLLEIVQSSNAQIVFHGAKIKAIIDSTKDDNTSISKLKSDFDDATKVLTLAHSSETRAKDLLLSLRQKIGVLAGQIRRGEAFSFGEEGSIFETSQDVKNLTKESAQANVEIEERQTEIANTRTLLKQETDELNIFKAEADRLEQSIEQNNKVIEELNSANETNYNEVIAMKRDVRQQKAGYDNLLKQKAEHTKSKQVLRRGHYELTTSLGQLRDEARAFRDRAARNGKHLLELKHSRSDREERLEGCRTRLLIAEREIESCNRDMQEIHRKADELNGSYTAVINDSKHLAQQKLECRRIARQLRSDLIDLQFGLAQSDNETRQRVRGISAEKLSLQTEKRKAVDAAFATEEVVGQAITVKSETRGEKLSLQRGKEKVLRLFNEIDEKRSERSQMDGKVQMTKEAVGIIKEQCAIHLQVLNDYNQKNADQTMMAERLRAERNNYKRQFEAVSVELDELQTQYGQLESEVKSLEEHRLSLLLRTIEMHADNMRVAARKKLLMDMTDGQMKRMLETERTISRLQAESQTLSHIWTEAQHDRLQMDKEHQGLENNLKVAGDELSKKCKTIERLRSQIMVEERFLRKCASQYTEKASQVVRFIGELASLEARTKELEAGRERMLALDYEAHRLTTEAMFERQKCGGLIHEFSVQRNVHRWDIMAAVDPNYVKQLKYRCHLTSKVDLAHRQLIALLEQREKLREQVARKQSHFGKSSREEVLDHIAKYEADIIAKDAQIEELRQRVNGNQPGMHSSLKDLAKVHGQVVSRRTNISHLRTQSVAAMRSQNQMGGVTWFLTEAPVEKVRGGGFVDRVPTALSRAGTNEEMGTLPELPRPEKRAKSMLNSVSHSKKVTKPITPMLTVPSPKKLLSPARRTDE